MALPTNSLVTAADWIVDLMTGTIATAVAVIAVASIGLLALGGRLPARRALSCIIGCFVVFGAGTIVAGLRGATDMTVEPPDSVANIPPPAPVARPTPPVPIYDPYAGASVPIR